MPEVKLGLKDVDGRWMEESRGRERSARVQALFKRMRPSRKEAESQRADLNDRPVSDTTMGSYLPLSPVAPQIPQFEENDLGGRSGRLPVSYSLDWDRPQARRVALVERSPRWLSRGAAVRSAAKSAKPAATDVNAEHCFLPQMGHR